MSLIIGIETSCSKYGLAIGRDGELAFSSEQVSGPPSRDLAMVLNCGLREANATLRETAGIAVNIGPGGLSAVRAGVAFANALAFALQKPILPLNYFSVVGVQASRTTDLPVISALPAPGGRAYVGLFVNGSVRMARAGDPKLILPIIAGDLDEAAVAGRLRSCISALLPELRVVDTEIEAPCPSTLVEIAGSVVERTDLWKAQVMPLDENAELFHEKA